MVDFGLLLVVDRASVRVLGHRVVRVASLVVHVFGQDLFPELVRLENRRVAVKDVDLWRQTMDVRRSVELIRTSASEYGN